MFSNQQTDQQRSKTRDILNTLRKLIEHEKSARAIGSLQEADAFASKIADLCDRYKVAVADVPVEQRGDDEDIGPAFWDPAKEGLTAMNVLLAWQRKMAVAVAYGHYCEMLFWRGINSFVFYGMKADAEIAAAMMSILCRAAIRAYETARGQGLVRTQFLLGFSMAIGQRYGQLRREQEACHSTSTQALVRQTDQRIKQKLEQADIKKAKIPKPPEYNQSLQSGFDAGMQHDLNTKFIQEGSYAKQLN